MGQRKINPWTWQDRYGFSQAIEVLRGERVLYCAGQTSSGADGESLHEDDMAAQCRQALENLVTVLDHAGMSLANVVRLNFYVTDVDRFLSEGSPVVGEIVGGAGIQPAGTLLGVSRLAFPELLIEIEATAVA